MLRSRVLSLTAGGSNIAGTISVPPARYAGLYYKFDPDVTQDVVVTNLGQTLLNKPNARNSDGVQDVLPPDMPLVSGNIRVELGNTVANDKADFQLFIDLE